MEWGEFRSLPGWGRDFSLERQDSHLSFQISIAPLLGSLFDPPCQVRTNIKATLP